MKLLDIAKKVDSFLDRLPPKQFKQVYTKINNLRKNCQPHDAIKLQGTKDEYRVDAGEYRIIINLMKK